VHLNVHFSSLFPETHSPTLPNGAVVVQSPAEATIMQQTITIPLMTVTMQPMTVATSITDHDETAALIQDNLQQ